MKLSKYLADNGLNFTQFARILGVSHKTIQRYCSDGDVPGPRTMALIHQWTGGSVEPNDFYDLPDTADEITAGQLMAARQMAATRLEKEAAVAVAQWEMLQGREVCRHGRIKIRDAVELHGLDTVLASMSAVSQACLIIGMIDTYHVISFHALHGRIDEL